MSSQPQLATTQTLWGLLVVGLMIQVAGFVIAVLQFPGIGGTFTRPEAKGDLVGMMFGLLGLGLGGVLSLTAVVGFGVLLGMRAHESTP